MVEPKLNPVAGAAAVVVAAVPKPGAVRATKKEQTQTTGTQLNLFTTKHLPSSFSSNANSTYRS